MHGAGQWHFSNNILVKNAQMGYPTRPQGSQNPGVALGYVEDFDEPRTNPREGMRLGAIRSRGCDVVLFSIRQGSHGA